MRGMRLDAEERTATITEFVDRLFEQPVPAEEYSSEITMPVSRPSSKSAAGGSTHTDSSRSHSDGSGSRNVNKIGAANGSSARTSGGGKNKKKRKRKSDRDKIKFILVSSVLGIIILAFIIAMIVTASEGEEEKTSAATTRAPVTVPTVTSAEESVSVSETTAYAQGGGYVLPNFEGAFYTTVSTNPQYSYLVFQATFDFSSEYKSGQIISQTVPEGTVVQSGTEIGVIVSKGPEKLPLPDYTGKKVEDYVKELSDSGIKYRIEEEITDETEEGLVARCSKEIGEDVMVAVSEEVVVYVAVKPEQTTTSLNAMEWEDDESTDLSADTSSGAENTSYTEDNGGDTIIYE